jgi:hypothetical protein
MRRCTIRELQWQHRVIGPAVFAATLAQKQEAPLRTVPAQQVSSRDLIDLHGRTVPYRQIGRLPSSATAFSRLV